MQNDFNLLTSNPKSYIGKQFSKYFEDSMAGH